MTHQDLVATLRETASHEIRGAEHPAKDLLLEAAEVLEGLGPAFQKAGQGPDVKPADAPETNEAAAFSAAAEEERPEDVVNAGAPVAKGKPKLGKKK